MEACTHVNPSSRARPALCARIMPLPVPRPLLRYCVVDPRANAPRAPASRSVGGGAAGVTRCFRPKPRELVPRVGRAVRGPCCGSRAPALRVTLSWGDSDTLRAGPRISLRCYPFCGARRFHAACVPTWAYVSRRALLRARRRPALAVNPSATPFGACWHAADASATWLSLCVLRCLLQSPVQSRRAATPPRRRPRQMRRCRAPPAWLGCRWGMMRLGARRGRRRRRSISTRGGRRRAWAASTA